MRIGIRAAVDLKKFNRDRKKIALVITRSAVRQQINFTKAVRRAVAERTPVLTGRAAASWNASVGAPDFEDKPAGFVAQAAPSRLGKVNLAGLRFGQRTFVANGVPYIRALNMGSSRKAPAGFVQIVVAMVAARLLRG